jgi:hypothetical protein
MAPDDKGSFDFDFDFDYNPSSDNREPGVPESVDVKQRTFMGGLGFRFWRIGFGAAYWARTTILSDYITLFNVNTSGNLVEQGRVNYTETGKMSVFRVPVGIRLTPQLSLGFTYMNFKYADDLKVNNLPSSSSNEKTTANRFAAGFQYQFSKNLKWGTWYQQSMQRDVDLVFDTGFNFQMRDSQSLRYPWILSSGVSMLPWGDRSMLLVDLNLIGSTEEGKLKEASPVFAAFAPGRLRNKGRKLAVEPHISWFSPLYKDSVFLYSIGGYYEAPRWEGLNGRFHGVVGGMLDFKWVMGIVALDYAKDFFEVQLSIR